MGTIPLQVRAILAKLGYEKLDDIVGRTDLLRSKDIPMMKTQHLDLSYIMSVCQLIPLNYQLLILIYASRYPMISYVLSECWPTQVEQH